MQTNLYGSGVFSRIYKNGDLRALHREMKGMAKGIANLFISLDLHNLPT